MKDSESVVRVSLIHSQEQVKISEIANLYLNIEIIIEDII